MRNPFPRWFPRRERRDIIFNPPDGSWWAGGLTESGATVTPINALSVPAVFACCQVLAQDVARTPIKLREKTAPDTFIDATDHPLFEILHDLANPEMTAYQFKGAMQWQLLTYGRAYAQIVRVDGRVVSLWPLDSAAMQVDRDSARRKRWTYSVNGQQYVYLFDSSAPPILELTMETPISRCKELIGTALTAQSFLGNFFRNNARPAGVITAPGAISDETAARLRDTWKSGYSGAANVGKTPVMELGVKFEPISSTNDDAQLNETMKALSASIAGAFRIPPWKIGFLENTNYSNMESGENAYITSTLDPLFESWEEALRRDLLTTRQFGAYSITFDRSALARNDLKSLNVSLQAGINSGYLSQNDCRRALGLNPIDGGDIYRVNLALAPTADGDVANGL